MSLYSNFTNIAKDIYCLCNTHMYNYLKKICSFFLEHYCKNELFKDTIVCFDEFIYSLGDMQ